MQTTICVSVRSARGRETCRAHATTKIVNASPRGGFDDASPVRGERTTLRPVDENDVDLLLAWHADPDVSRFWDDETFTRASMLARFARPDVTPYLVLAAGDPIATCRRGVMTCRADHTAEWMLLEFSPYPVP